MLGERAVRVAIETLGLEDKLQHLEQQALIDWPEAGAARYQLLHVLYEDFVDGDHPLRADFDSYCAQAGDPLEQHCRFEALLGEAQARGLGLDW
ncbi:hypothetical protein D3C72_2262130 [compost metagenome]